MRLSETDVRPTLVAASAAGALSGVLVALAFPPTDAGPLVLVGLVPLLWIWQRSSPARAALGGLVFGIVYFGIVLEWSRYFGAVAIVPLVLLEASFVAGTGALVGALGQRGVRSAWLVAAAWVVFEGLRARFPLGGMPWGELGVALHDVPWARALASLGGVPLVSFVVVAVNALLLELVVALRARRIRSGATAAVGLAALILLAGLADLTRFQPEVTGRVRFALLQGNDQNRKLTAAEFDSDYLFRRHLALARRLKGDFDLIVFPESSLERDPITHRDVRMRLVDLAREHHAVVLANARVPAGDGGILNANIAYAPDGRRQGIYAKQHLVPFGEYIPMRDALSFIGELEQIPYDYEAGDRRVLFDTRGRRFGSVICFESAFAPLVRDYVRDGAELLVVSTNNRSYRRSGLAAQHLAMSQMRAAETGRPVLHASISGITGVIEPDGAVRHETELFRNEITIGAADTTAGETVYVRFGDWVLVGCGIALVVAAAVAVRRTRGAS